MQEHKIQIYDSFSTNSGMACLQALLQYLQEEHLDKRKKALPSWDGGGDDLGSGNGESTADGGGDDQGGGNGESIADKKRKQDTSNGAVWQTARTQAYTFLFNLLYDCAFG